MVKYDEKSCGIVVFRHAPEADKNLYLLLHYPGGHFDFPKGHVEKGEDEKQTALRELIEETGISDLDFIDGFREEISYKYRRRKQLSNKQVVFFLGKTETEKIKISHEHHGHLWLPYEAALKKLTFENARELLRKAGKFLSKKD